MVGMRRNERPTRRRQKVTREERPTEDENLEDLGDMDVDLNIDDLDGYDDDLSDLDDDYDTKENRSQNNKETMNKNYQNRNPKRINSRDSNKKNLLMLLIGFVTIIVIVLALVLIFGKDDKSDTNNTTQDNTTQENTIGQIPKNNTDVTGGGATPPPANQNPQQNTYTQPNQQGVVMEDNVNPGLPDTKNGNKMNNNGEMTDTKGFISDVNGNKIPKDFVVQRVSDETDFVNYVKRRGMTGDGIELLWLDAQYKGIPYSVQVPFKIWKELDQQGITVVDMEVLYLEDGSKVISYMKVKDNYKEILEEKK